MDWPVDWTVDWILYALSHLVLEVTKAGTAAAPMKTANSPVGLSMHAENLRASYISVLVHISHAVILSFACFV